MLYIIGMSLPRAGVSCIGIDLYNMKEPDSVLGHSDYYSSQLVAVSSIVSKVRGAEDKDEGDEGV